MPHTGSTLLESTMSSGSKATLDTLPPHITNGVEDVGAPANSINAIKSLIETVRDLASQPVISRKCGGGWNIATQCLLLGPTEYGAWSLEQYFLHGFTLG